MNTPPHAVWPHVRRSMPDKQRRFLMDLATAIAAKGKRYRRPRKKSGKRG